MNNKPIDKIRNAASSGTVGTAEDASPITDLISIDDEMLLAVTEKHIYEIRLADQIDPGRTNINLPNLMQPILAHGSDSTLVARTFLTASIIFKSINLADKSIAGRVQRNSLDAATHICALSDAISELEQVESAGISSINLSGVRNGRRQLNLPITKNLIPRTKNIFQIIDHFYQTLFGLTTLFFGESYKKRWFETFAEFVLNKFGKDDAFVAFVASSLPLLRLVRYTRDAIEHPTPKRHATIKDFELLPDGNIAPPTIEVVHDITPLGRTKITALTKDLTEELSKTYEAMIAYLADRNSLPVAGMDVKIFEFEPKMLGQKHVRYSLGVRTANGIARFG